MHHNIIWCIYTFHLNVKHFQMPGWKWWNYLYWKCHLVVNHVLLRQGISIHFRLSWNKNVFMFFGIFPKGFSEPLKYWKGVRIYKLTIRPISNVTLGNKEENILHYLKLFLFYSFSPRIFIIPSLQETIKIANLFVKHFIPFLISPNLLPYCHI